jgi:hypothetical protein
VKVDTLLANPQHRPFHERRIVVTIHVFSVVDVTFLVLSSDRRISRTDETHHPATIVRSAANALKSAETSRAIQFQINARHSGTKKK